jgi:type 1 glutamine amidotransferase
MIGADFIIHGTMQIGRVQVIDPKFPGFGKLGASFELHEEWYSLTDFSPDLHVLLLQDTAAMRDPYAGAENWPPTGWNAPYQRPPYPSTWARMHGKGRVFYTSLAHREENWKDPKFQELLFGGIAWAVGNVDADVTPNIAKVAPQAHVLPPVSMPVVGDPDQQRQYAEMLKKGKK